MKPRYWIKFENERPMLWTRDTFEALWHDVREYMMRSQCGRLEWMVQE